MDKFYNVTDLQFDKELMYFKVDGILYKIKICDASDKLAKASEQIRNDYKITPSGYGIHWRQLDEDLSINGLIRIAKK
jgi:hypothetical protein